MLQTGPSLDQTDPRTSPENVLLAVARHRELMRAERLPQDPPHELGLLVAEMQHLPSDEDVVQINAWEGEQVVGQAALFLPLIENTHLGFVDVSVQSPYRRRGLGRTLLRRAAILAQERGRTTLIGGTSDRVAAGGAFAAWVGAQAALPTHTNQLDLSELEVGLLDRWVGGATERAPQYEVWLNEGAYPAGRLAEIADLWNVMNTAPRGDLDMHDWQATPERVREWEDMMARKSERRLAAFAQQRETGQLVGLSELFWQPGRESLLFQGATCVRPEHRRQGLGRWIKAANLRRALELNPAARFVRTGNADVNEGMLAINHALGFRPFIAHTDWQVPLEQVLARLG